MARPKNSTENMRPKELRALLDGNGFDLPLAAHALKIPYRTLQDYVYGVTGIPADVADRIRAYFQEWRRYMKERRRKLQAEINRAYPGGIGKPRGERTHE